MGNAKSAPREDSSSVTRHSSRISLIVAMARNRVIGANGKIPWHLPGELKLFKSLTMGHHIIMGRKTWESIGRLLPGRTTVVVTRQRDYRVPGAIVAHTLEEGIRAGAGDDEIFVIGGAELFRDAIPLADRIYLTTVDADIPGDTTMPRFEGGEWRAEPAQVHPADERNPHGYGLVIHERVR
jgi:dihydrofolate reductase